MIEAIRPLYDYVFDLSWYIRDAKMDKQIDLRKGLEGLREDVCKVMEPTISEVKR